MFPSNKTEGLVLSEGDSLENIDIIVEKKVSLIGKVIDSETMLPLEEIWIFAGKENEEFPECPESISNKEGEFIFYNLEHGKYWLLCMGASHQSEKIEIWIEKDQINKITIEAYKTAEEEHLKHGIRREDIKY